MSEIPFAPYNLGNFKERTHVYESSSAVIFRSSVRPVREWSEEHNRALEKILGGIAAHFCKVEYRGVGNLKIKTNVV